MRSLTELAHGERSVLHLCRHGEVDAYWRGRVYGGADVPLAPEGERRFEQLAQSLAGGAGARLAFVASSDLARAVHGAAQIAGALGLEHRQDPRLREVDRGAWTGRLVEELRLELPDELAAFEADPFGYDRHGGESLQALQRRIWPAFEALAAQADATQSRAVFVVCHGQVIRVAVAHVLGIASALAMRLAFDHGGITTFERYENGLWIVRRVNASSLPEL